jgi:CBS-domain-containing membrane protein
MTKDVVTVGPDVPFPELVDRLLRYGISGLPVVDESRHLLGIVTEADLVSKEALGGHRRRALEVLGDLVSGGSTGWAIKAKGRTAGEVMTAVLETATPGEDLRVAARRMLDHHVKRLPVLDDGRLVGIVSRSDLLRVLHRSDDDLSRDVAALLIDPMRVPEAHEVTATVADGVVTLEGTVRFPNDLGVLTGMCWRIPGVVDVRNVATAREPDPPKAGPGRTIR